MKGCDRQMRTNESIKVPDSTRAVMSLLEEAGFECFVVGGYLRDTLLGRATFDIDLATSATPEDVMRSLSRYLVIPTGLRHGTVTVLTTDGSIEITTFREDGMYSDFRHPDVVRYAKTIEEDLARRDFTINALAWNEKRGLIDPWDGQSDLKKGLIRTVGDANQRFREDALRIFRGLRLSGELSFQIEERTSDAMRSCAQLLKHVARERLQVELNRLLIGENALSVMQGYVDILSVVIPELSILDDCAPSPLNVAFLRASSMGRDIPLRLAALLCDLENALEILKRLRYDNATIDRVEKLIAFQSEKLFPEKRSVWRGLYRYGQKDFLDGMRLRVAGERAHANIQGIVAPSAPADTAVSPTTAAIAQIADDLIRRNRILELKDLAVNGHDLLGRGYRGQEVGAMLEILLEKVCVDDFPNERESLLAAIDSKSEN